MYNEMKQKSMPMEDDCGLERRVYIGGLTNEWRSKIVALLEAKNISYYMPDITVNDTPRKTEEHEMKKNKCALALYFVRADDTFTALELGISARDRDVYTLGFFIYEGIDQKVKDMQTMSAMLVSRHEKLAFIQKDTVTLEQALSMADTTLGNMDMIVNLVKKNREW